MGPIRRRSRPTWEENMSLLKIENLNVYYGDLQALFGVRVDVNEREVTTIVGANAGGNSELKNT